MPPGTQTRVIRVVADTKGNQELQKFAKDVGAINKNTKDLSNTFKGLAGGALAFGGLFSVRELSSFSDEIQNLNNRLVAFTGNQQDATDVMNDLVDTARRTNQPLDSVANGYFRMSLALKDANISQASLIELTEVVANTFRLSGASAQEATNATIQLGQAFSLGVLRGQDLRSVMSQNVTLTRILRQEFGNNLLKAAEQGLITVPKIMELLFKNMNQVNDAAAKMSATFEQSAVKALDAFKLKIFEVNEALGLSKGFAKIVDGAIKNMGALVSIMTIFATATLPAVIAGLVAAAAAMGPLSLLVGSLGVGLLAVVALFGESWDISELIVQFKSGVSTLLGYIDKLKAGFYDLAAAVSRFNEPARKSFEKLAEQARKSATLHEYHAKALWIEYDASKALAEQNKKEADAAARRAADLAKALATFGGTDKAKTMLVELNKQYLAGAISLSEYNQKILEIEESKAWEKFKEGEIDLGKLNDALRKVELFRINRDFKDGALTIDEYNRAIRSVQLQNLREDLEAGRVSLADFNSKLASVSDSFSAGGAFRSGLQDYLNSIGTTTQQVANVIKNAFSNLEDRLLEFVKTGKFEFGKFTQAILDDLTKIILRATIVQPLAQGILSAFGPTAAAGATGGAGGSYLGSQPIPNAHGNVYDNGIRKFASGGVVSGSTIFGYGSNKLGMMGEAGPEAIIPLKRSGGDLGVAASVTPVTINVINQSGNNVEQRETTGPNGEKTIDILITGKVREGIASGKFDKVMQQSYGVSRKGS